jgi:diguanylate cyclase (GGDEF)-like protein/PAS domain S-box-containing protein
MAPLFLLGSMDSVAAHSLLFELLPIGAYRTTPAGRQLRANGALVRLNGFSSEAALLAAATRLESDWYVQPGRRQQFRALIERQGQLTNFVSEVYRLADRSRIWVREAAYVVRNADGEVLYYEGTVEDITQSHNTTQALAENEARWRLALEAAGEGVWDWRVQTGEEYCSDQLVRMFGFEPGELQDLAQELDDRTHPDDLARMRQDREDHFNGETPAYRNEHRVRCKNGSWKWVLSRGMVVSRDAQGRPLRMIGTHTDISAHKQADALIWQQAHFDALTGLPNRRMLRQQLDQVLSQVDLGGQGLAVMFIDLDQFKAVNDTLGHNMGDRLLVQAAARLRECVGPADVVARMGGDEFTVVVGETRSVVASGGWSERLQPLLQALLGALSAPFDLGPHRVFVSASIGVACFPDDAQQVEDLFKHADQALYVAKGEGRNRYRFFSREMQAAAQWRARLEAELRNALPLQQFSVVYQPMVALATGRVHKAEALLRWSHPTLGAVSPAHFIPVAEASGLIAPIGDWVFDQAAAQVANWRQAFDPDFQVSINKSPAQFHQRATHTVSWVERLRTLGLPGNSVAIEITEGLLLETNEAVNGHLNDLRLAGMDVSLDDFGTGYSSLSYLQKLDIDFLKIDQSFVRNLAPDSTDLTLCKAIIAMANALGMQVVAEGVETAEQRDLLRQAGCHFGQGYLFARPMAADVFERWMRDSTPASRMAQAAEATRSGASGAAGGSA